MADTPHQRRHDDETRDVSAEAATAATVRMTTMGSDHAPMDLEIPRELGPVRLVRELGRGGMGVVYLGHHRFLDRDVAVKFLLSAISGTDDPAYARFMEETSAAARIEHENLVSILHADVVDRVPYLVMQYVDGPTLAGLIDRHGPLSVPATVAALAAISGAIGALHTESILHRDIKPSNVLVGSDGHLYVSDFGLAMERSITQVGRSVAKVAGTPAYMAPEAFDGEASARSDVYALGILAYELLTASVPFSGSLSEVRPLHEEAPVPLERLREAGVPDALVELVERSSYKKTVFRYKTGEHFRRALMSEPGTEAMIKSGTAELARLAGASQAGAGGAESASDSPSSSSYFERLSQMADERLRAVSVRAEDVQETEPSPTPAPTPRAGTHRPRVDLSLAVCPGCTHALADLPRRYRCPECSFLYDESMFVVEGVWPADGREKSGIAGRVAGVFAACLSLVAAGLFVMAVIAGGALWWVLFAVSSVPAMLLIVASITLRPARQGAVSLLIGTVGPSRVPASADTTVPWREFFEWSFAQRPDGRWELVLQRDVGAGLLYAITRRSAHDRSNYALVFEADVRRAAKIRNEVRRRIRHAAGY